jgi:integrase
MKCIWTSVRPSGEIEATLKRVEIADPGVTLPKVSLGRVRKRFPIFLDGQGTFLNDAFSFFYHIAFIKGSTRSERTLETYAESILAWLRFAEGRGLDWRRPNNANLGAFRDSMLTREIDDQPSGIGLAKRTVNLRLAALSEFLKHLDTSTSAVNSVDLTAEPSGRRADPRLMKVRIYSKRPRALTAVVCRSLTLELKLTQRLVWQWMLCTGLRSSSVLALTLAQGKGLAKSSLDPHVTVPSKGSKEVTVYVPVTLREATQSYLDVVRPLLKRRRGAHNADSALFLNSLGNPLKRSAFYRAFSRATTKLKVKAHPHQARSTFASRVRQLLEQLREQRPDIDPVKVVQSLLGHSDVRTTEDYLESIDVPSVEILQLLEALGSENFPLEVR